MKNKYAISIETDTPTTPEGIAFQNIGKNPELLNRLSSLLASLETPPLKAESFNRVLELVLVELEVTEADHYRTIKDWVSKKRRLQ